MLKLVILIALINIACAEQFWSRCTHQANIPMPHRIIAQSCDHQRCRVVRGQIVTPTAYMFFNGVHEELIYRATAFILGIGVEVPIDSEYSDACNRIFANGVLVNCPVQPNVEYSVGAPFEVPTFLPAFTNTLSRIEMVDRGRPVICFEFRADLL